MPDIPPGPTSLYRTLGHSFREPALLQSALIHTSYVNERPGRGLESNERLEFLGDAARRLLMPFIDQEVESGFSPQRVVDAKSRLQQITQARFEATPVYNLVDHSGPGHAPIFVVEVRAGPDVVARGTGHSKRTAQQAAAHAALQMLDVTEGYEEPVPDRPDG
jgi:dsRNA-specific ribonuclease